MDLTDTGAAADLLLPGVPLEGVSILKDVPYILLGGVDIAARPFGLSYMCGVDIALPGAVSGEHINGDTCVEKFFEEGDSRALGVSGAIMAERIDTGAAAAFGSVDFFLLTIIMFSSGVGH